LLASIALLFGILPCAPEITALRIASDETISIGDRAIRYITGIIAGKADLGESTVPSLERLSGLRYESDFRIWIPVSEGNGRLWFSVLNRGEDLSNMAGLRKDVLRRGGAVAWCAWQAKYVSGPHLRLETEDGSIPQAYGLIVVRDFVAFMRYGDGSETVPNPVAGKVNSTFAYGLSQSAWFIRSFVLYGLNTTASGRVFDGLISDGGGASYIDLFRPDSNPSSTIRFTSDTLHPPYGWSELMQRSGTDAKVFALNAESEFYDMMTYMTHRDSPPDNVRVYEFPLGGHGGIGWADCIAPLAEALEKWVCERIPPPDNRMFTLEKRESPRASHLLSEPAELPMLDELGIPIGGVRLPLAEVPTIKYRNPDVPYSVVALTPSELTLRYGTPDNYRRLVAEAVRRLVQERFLRQSAADWYIAKAEDFSW
jgi:hypothetical protein